MFYLSGKRKGTKYGVVDTTDGVETFHTMSELLTVECRGTKIYGIFRKYGYLHCFGMSLVSIRLLNSCTPCTVRVSLSSGLSFMQTIYMGYRILSGRLEFVFFNDGGMSGLCILTSEQLLGSEVRLDFEGVDHRRAEVLMRRLKDSGEFVL